MTKARRARVSEQSQLQNVRAQCHEVAWCCCIPSALILNSAGNWIWSPSLPRCQGITICKITRMMLHEASNCRVIGIFVSRWSVIHHMSYLSTAQSVYGAPSSHCLGPCADLECPLTGAGELSAWRSTLSISTPILLQACHLVGVHHVLILLCGRSFGTMRRDLMDHQ